MATVNGAAHKATLILIEESALTKASALPMRTPEPIGFCFRVNRVQLSSAENRRAKAHGLVILPIDLPLPLDTVSYAIRHDVPVSALQQRFHQALEQAALKYNPASDAEPVTG